MQEFNQADAARALGVHPSNLRSAVARGRIAAREDAAGQTVISDWELDRHRNRRVAFTLSPHLQEIPVAEEPLRLVLQTSVATAGSLGEQTATLLRVYRIPGDTGAQAVIVLGDLQRFSSATLPDHRDALIAAARPQVAAALGKDEPAAVVWVTLGGSFGDIAPRFTDITVLGVVEDPTGVRIHKVDLATLGLLEDRLGQPVLTWPAVHPDDPDQEHQWDLARIRRLPNDVWTIDQYSGATNLVALRRIHQAAAGQPARQAVVAMISSLLVEPIVTSATRPGPLPLPSAVTERLAVQVLSWRADAEDAAFVARLASSWPEDTYLPTENPEVCATTVDWLRSIDQYSPTPDPHVAGALRYLIDGVALGFEFPAHAPLDYTVEPIGITGATGKEWRNLLTPAPVADPADNSETSRQFRALTAALADQDHWIGTYERIEVDPAGVPIAFTKNPPPDLDAQGLVVRPRTYDHLRSRGTVVEAQGESAGDLAIFLRLADGTLTLLPHVAWGQVNWGYPGGGPAAAVQDIVAAHAALHGLTESDAEFDQAVRAFICTEGRTSFTINLDTGEIR